MEQNTRRQKVLQTIKDSDKAISASALAKLFNVSRQIIVGDVALLRASGEAILATPRGYVMNDNQKGICKTIALIHNQAQTKDELYTFVDLGAEVIDVIVEHGIYGQIQGMLHIKSRFDVDRFIENVTLYHAKPLSDLTNGLHLHTIRCENEEVYQNICDALKAKGYLYEKER